MKALILEEPGSIEGLKIILDREKPIPKENEIRVKVYASGLNPSDYQVAEYTGLVDEEKRVLGLDIAGTVDAVGSNVNNFKVGDRVYYLRSIENLHGGFAEYSCTTAHTVSKLPGSIPFDVAAAVPGAGFTAYQAIIEKLRVESRKTILIHGAAGGVGGYAVQLAKMRGLKIYATCSEENTEYVKSLGADEIIDYRKEDVYEKISKLTKGRGVDYILNTIGSDSASKDLDIAAFGGEIAFTAGFPDFNKLNFYEKGISLHELALGAVYTNGDYTSQCNLSRIGDEFAELLENKKLVPPKITLISLEEVPKYLMKLKERKIVGKIIAKIIN